MDTPALTLLVITSALGLPDLADSDEWAEAERLRALLQGLAQAGYGQVTVLKADAQLPENLTRLKPDVLIVDAQSGARDALEHVVWATADAPRPIVLFTEERNPAHMREAMAAGVAAYVVAGLAPERVRPIIDVALARFEHEQGLRQALASAQAQLAHRDVVAQAKTLLMQRHGLSEPQAYARLRRAAMNEGQTVAEMARRLVDMAQLFG